jgi:hypothetical protein
MAKNVIKKKYATYFEQLRFVDTSYNENFIQSKDDINFTLQDVGKDFSFKQLINDEALTNPNISEVELNKPKNEYLKIDKNFDNIEDPIYQIDDAPSKVETQPSMINDNKKKMIIRNKLKNIKLSRY